MIRFYNGRVLSFTGGIKNKPGRGMDGRRAHRLRRGGTQGRAAL